MTPMTLALATATRRRSRVADALVLGGLAAVLLAAECAGRAGRILSPSPVIERCDGPEAVLDVLRSSGVRGRVLAHFARDIAVQQDPGWEQRAPLSARNYVRRAVEAGYVRRIVHVLSEREWPSAEQNLRRLPVATASGSGFQVAWEGTPIDVVRLRDLPALAEPYVADVDADQWTPEELELIASRLARPPGADVVAWYGAGDRFPEGRLRAAER